MTSLYGFHALIVAAPPVAVSAALQQSCSACLVGECRVTKGSQMRSITKTCLVLSDR